MGGKKNVLAIRMMVNFQPNIPTSIGNRVTAHNDHPVRKATMVPTLAPVRKSPEFLLFLSITFLQYHAAHYGQPMKSPALSAQNFHNQCLTENLVKKYSIFLR